MPQVRPIADVKANLLRPATTSQFEVFIPMDAVSQTALKQAGIFLNKDKEWQLNLLCSRATLPGSSLQTYDDIYNDFTGATERYVHRRQYEEQAEFTFYVNADNYIPIRFFETWMDYVVGVETEEERRDTMSPEYFYRMNYPRGKAGTGGRDKNALPPGYMSPQGLRIVKFERDFMQSEANLGGGTLEYTFINAYPYAITSMPVSYEQSDLLEVTVSFRYLRYVMNKGWFKQANLDPMGGAIEIMQAALGGDWRNVMKLWQDSGATQAMLNAAGNSARSIAAFVGGEDFVNNIKGASRWATNTFDWLKGIGRR